MTASKLFALVTNQGTAAYESALCDVCLSTTLTWGASGRADEKATDYARRQVRNHAAATGDDVADDAPFVDVTGNEALECQVCGWPRPQEEVIP